MSQDKSSEDRFSGFTRLGEGQYYRRVIAQSAVELSATASTRPSVEPDLIVFCSWAVSASILEERAVFYGIILTALSATIQANDYSQAALPKHIQKYLVPYYALYPHSDMLLLESSMNNLAWVSDAAQMRSLMPAVNAVSDLSQVFRREAGTGAVQAREPIILVHAFSNGGAHSAVQLAQAYREHLLRVAPVDYLPAELPVSALILDSSPGRADYNIGIQVVLSMVPKASFLWRSAVTILAHAMITSIVTAHKLGIAENIASKLWRCLNDLEGPFLLKKGPSSRLCEDESDLGKDVKVVPRTYIYSNRDQMIPWQCVVEHGSEAREAVAGALSRATGDNGHLQDVIRLEGFAGSAHVSHSTLDRERYWRLVRETLERAC